eukprot:scaffold623905_cov21-Prasinocladus_malaysianus.AAC.1
MAPWQAKKCIKRRDVIDERRDYYDLLHWQYITGDETHPVIGLMRLRARLTPSLLIDLQSDGGGAKQARKQETRDDDNHVPILRAVAAENTYIYCPQLLSLTV